MRRRRAFLCVAAVVAACGSYGENQADVPVGEDAGGIDAGRRDLDASGDSAADGGDGGAPVLETIASALPDAVDFDLLPTGYALLRTNASRIDSCVGEMCTTLVEGSRMPTETTTRTNASIAYLPPTAPLGDFILVAQGGSDSCVTNCMQDSPDAPGLFRLRATPTDSSPATRLTATIPLVTGKTVNGRVTDGILVGRNLAQAIAQRVSNEAPFVYSTTVFSGTGATPITFPRGNALNGGIEAFSFAAVPTAGGSPGWVGTGKNFAESQDGGAKTGLVPVLATATVIDGPASDVFAIAQATPDGQVLSFHNSGPLLVETHGFPFAKQTAHALVATQRHLAVVDAFDGDAGTSAVVHGCPVTDVRAERCAPWSVSLPFETVIRIRAAASAIWILGHDAGGASRLVRISLP